MNPFVEAYRETVLDVVATRIAREQRAGYPLGTLDRRFEDITADMLMADWERVAHTVPVDQMIRRLCYGDA